MPRLSIVIPCLGGAAEFDGTLVSVLQNRPADCEVLVAHTQAYGDPYGLDGEVRFLHVAARGLTELINAAQDEARGDILHIVGCGLEATEGWAAAALTHFDDPEVAAVTPVVLAADRQSVVAAGVRWTLGGARRVVADQRLLTPGAGRLRARVLGPTLQAAFYRRDVLAALDGFDARVGDGFSDVDAALAIQSLGLLHRCEPASRLIQSTAAAAPLEDSGFIAGRAAQRVFRRYAAARGMAAALALHPFTVLADFLRQAPYLVALTSLFGRAAAACELEAPRRQEERITAAGQRLAAQCERQATLRLPQPGSRSASVNSASERRRAA